MRGERGLRFRARAARWGAASLTLAVVLAITVVAAVATAQAGRRTREQEARAQTAAAATGLERRVDHYVEALRGVAAWLRTDGWPSRDRFHQFVSAAAVRSRYPGIQVIGAAELAAAGRTLPITYLEPVAGNQVALGFDFFSEPRRKEAALAARDLGQPRVTAPLTLIQETGAQFGVLVMVPVYRTGAVLTTRGQRRAAFTGVVYGAFRMGDLVRGAAPADVSRIWLSDTAPLYAPIGRSTAPADAQRTRLDVEGRTWLVRYAATPDLGPLTRYGPAALAVVGTAVAVLAGALVLSLTSASARAGALARRAESEARRLEHERARLATRFELLVDCSGEGIYGVDLDGRITFVNQQCARYLGWELDELLGRYAHEVMHHHRLDGSVYPAEECPVSSTFRHGTTHRVDSEVFWRRDGTPMAVEYIAAPLRRDGHLEGGVVTFSDITDRKRTEQALRDAVATEREAAGRLREIDQYRTDLVSTVSHELRTPLTSLSGYLELLLDGDAGPITSEQSRMVEVAHRSARRLSLLVEDLLTLSRIDAGAFTIRQDDVELGPLLAAAVETIAPLAADRGLALHTDFRPDLGVVRGDVAHLERVLRNLLSNAVKFTLPGGAVTLAGRRAGDEVVLTVRDTGIGIPAEEQSRLFDRFFRSSNANQEAIQGTGLSLSIVKTIVEHHGGRITASSGLGEGTTMTVTLPVRAPARVN